MPLLKENDKWDWHGVKCAVPPNLGKTTNMSVNLVKGKRRVINRVYNIG